MTTDEISIPKASTSEFHLVCKRSGEAYPLETEILIGREIDCTVRLLDTQIRRYHAKISISDDGFFLEDLNAKNNTYLNGCRIGTGAWITLGDEINLDGVRFGVEPAKVENKTKIESPTIIKVTSPYKAPEMPFSNQDVVEATRAMEERAKARLQSFKAYEESGKAPDWEEFIAKRFKEKPAAETTTVQTTDKAASPVVAFYPTKKQSANRENNSDTISELAAANDPTPEINEPLIHPMINTISEDAIIADPDLMSSRNKTSLATGIGPRLEIKTAPLRGKIYLLATTDAKKSWTIGRATNADVQLSEMEIDLIHAHIELTNELNYKIRTTRSTNGMLVNGMFKNEAILSQGDEIQFGRTEFRFLNDLGETIRYTDTHKSSGVNYGLIAAGLVILGALLAALLNVPQ